MIKKEFPNLFETTVSYTSRGPRPGEVNGKDYYFATEAEMKKMIQEDKFIEHCIVHGNIYGTPKSEIQRIVKAHKICIIEIEVFGAQKISKSNLETNFMFIYPPSTEELKTRITKRGTETPEAIKTRLTNSLKELEIANNSPLYRYKLINGDLQSSYNKFKEMIMTIYKDAIDFTSKKKK